MAAVALSSKILGAGGRPLIVLHGFLGMGDNWASHARIWAEQGFEVHLVDQRNHGRSPHTSSHSYPEMVQDALAYAESHFKPGPLAWLGHSMGGKVVMEFAARYPSWVERMVVVDIGPKAYPPHHQYIIDAMKSLNLLELGSRTEADRAIEVYLKDWGIRQFLLKNLEWNSDKQLGWRCNLPVLEASMSRIGKPLGPLDNYVGACLFVRGLESDYLRDDDWPGIVKHFPAAQLESVAGAGHWVHAEQPQAFQLAVGSFLKS